MAGLNKTSENLDCSRIIFRVRISEKLIVQARRLAVKNFDYYKNCWRSEVNR